MLVIILLVVGKSEDDDTPASPIPLENIAGAPSSSASVTTFDGYLSNLSNCINRQLIDTAATQFITNFNNKGNRKRLLSNILRVPRNRSVKLQTYVQRLMALSLHRLDLLSFYARLIGILAPCVPDIGPEIVHSLEKEFYHHVSYKF